MTAISNTYSQATCQPPQGFKALNAATIDEEKWTERFYTFTGSLKVVMSIVNNATIKTVMLAVEAMEQTPLFRNQVKKDLKQVSKAYDEHLRTLKYWKYHGCDIFQDNTDASTIIADRNRIFDIYLQMGQNDYPRLYRHIMMIELQMLHAMTKRQIPNCASLAKLFTAYTLAKHSKIIFGYLMEDCKKFLKADLTPLFQPFYMEQVVFLIDRASHNCGLSHILDVDNPAHNVKNMQIAIKAYENAVQQCFSDCKGADKAVEDNKDLITEEAYQRYRMEYDDVTERMEKRKHRTYDEVVAESKK